MPGDPPLVAFNIDVPESDEETAAAALWETGTRGVEVTPGASGRLTLLAYFEPRHGLEDEIHAALASCTLQVSVQPTEIPKVDWLERFRELFRHFRVESFHIAPPWDVPATVPEDEPLILMDPGRAFGTGTHESTRLCLRLLRTLAADGPLGQVLDLGTGTGLLAIAARVLGAEPVVAVDNDPEALAVARRHLELNGASVGLALTDGARGLAPGRFDVVVANLTAPLLLERREEIGSLCAPGARLVLSGLLAEDLDRVRSAYTSLGPVDVATEAEWVGLLVRVA